MPSPRVFDPFSARSSFDNGFGDVAFYRLAALEDAGLCRLSTLPYSIRVLLESVLRNCDGFEVTEDDVRNLAAWSPNAAVRKEIPFKPARVVLQDFTGVPAVVDLAAMRAAMRRMGGDPARVNPLCQVDLVIDHSIQTDYYGSGDALEKNVDIEFARNRERYALLHWAQKAFRNLRVVPPSVGIIHQVNLEYLAGCVLMLQDARGPVAALDTVVGTDSHTTMINGLGVLGWGVGGIEAEAVMLGQPYYMLAPDVLGLELVGELPPGATATDLVLTVTQMLRKEGVVGKFIEYYGEGAARMDVADRAVLANMSPEYGATMGFFPIDERTIVFLRETGRPEADVARVERYTREQGLFREADAPIPQYTKSLRLDLATIEPSLAGPKRPQDRVALRAMKQTFEQALTAPVAERGFALDDGESTRTADVHLDGKTWTLGHGAVVIASITSCTNTSNPHVMLAAGLLAKKAVARGLRAPSYVKTSLAPGSRVVTEYLQAAGLMAPLAQLGFDVVGYGCLTCIGNSGPLPEPVAEAVTSSKLVVSAVLSGNRNFEGRVNPLVKANYLASPPLVVAFALAGTTAIDLTREPLGVGADGQPVFLSDVWPSNEEIEAVASSALDPSLFHRAYEGVFDSNPKWNAMPTEGSELFAWDESSTYIQEPPFLVDLAKEPSPIRAIGGARCLALLGDSVTTDHISPAGSIKPDSPAGRHLQDLGVRPADFNSYGARRGNDRVMTRGTFANIRIRNQLAPGTEGGLTRHLPSGEVLSIYDAATRYASEGTPLLVIAGTEYGTGSSRDWAAKGTQLLGARAVIASSYERIHRGNLVGMGVLPLELPVGVTWQSLGLTGEETFEISGLDDSLTVGASLVVRATQPDGTVLEFAATARIDTPIELEYYRHGGILPYVFRKLMAS